jgi:tungstate transport system ATP-binding protein
MLLELNEVHLRLDGFDLLKNINLKLHAGETLALVGANGCGKSTLLRLMHGLIEPSRGRVHKPIGLEEAMLFQHPHMLNMRVSRQLAMGFWLKGVAWSRAKVKTHELLHSLGLMHCADQNARSLSVGQQQMLSMGLAGALGREILFLDEPTASLDPKAKAQVEEMMVHWVKGQMPGPCLPRAVGSSARTLVFASHHLGQVKRLATRVIYLERGSIVADMSVDAFFYGSLEHSHPSAHLFLRGHA